MRTNEDAAASSCPSCGSPRLVVLAGERQVQPKRLREGSAKARTRSERRCIGQTDGVNCCQPPRPGSYFCASHARKSTPPLAARRCHGKTATGKPCRSSSLLGRDFCGNHARKPYVEVITTPRRIEEVPVSRVLALQDAGYQPVDGSITAPMPAVLAALAKET
jgi:hypothetical protein